ncbi:polysaccharide deacetylase family protein [Lactococcus piscium]|uniref:NodB homology domain-containing protein n=1 Tax=Pseudolactococcus paracarnosus TaxID=2749962 RepID=A0A7L4WE82_9LACT|nr:polysaccharide deacetylase family protein [Lactococcus paracarnosus]MCJ1995042.1 polysaccharide deacetylase family protein [Lactococcus paracarnosus]QDJ28507.1 hypothetical protein BHS01_08190 [Lactococcus paracarnosus]SPC38387.1 Polysaccharide deacetylase (modular protein) [Lactococcus piscium]
MKKVLGISFFILLAALASVLIFQVFASKTGQSVNRPIKLSSQTTNKVVAKSSDTSKKDATSQALAPEDKQKTEPKWTKSDTPIKFPILMYHHIADVVNGNTLFVPANEFKMEMTALKNAGYYTLSPDEAYRVLTTNEKPADKIVWVTFDDGYKNAQETAVPILTELGMKGSFFIITGMIGNEDKMADSGLLAIKSNPLMSLGSHTVNHLDLQYATQDVATKELVESKQYLDSLLQQDTSVICYPSGRYNEQTPALATAAGYKLGLTTHPGLASSTDGLLSLNRVRMAYGQTETSFMTLIGNQ